MFEFKTRTAFMVLLLAVHVFGDSLSKQNNSTKFSSSIVSDHGSKLIQPVPLVADRPHHTVQSENFTNLVRLEDVLMVFDLNELAAKWTKIQHEFKSDCALNMMEYFRGLQQHKLWAIKSKLHVKKNQLVLVASFCFCSCQ